MANNNDLDTDQLVAAILAAGAMQADAFVLGDDSRGNFSKQAVGYYKGILKELQESKRAKE